ncbi:MAG: acyl-CoA thioesterase [Cellvibrionaceae bacterium]|nr:acyl-CoA thioesterase [Cellvibrionaceae bacterium]
MTAKTLCAQLEYQIPFFDVDSYRVVWHGNYANYFEMVRCQLLQDIGFTYADMEQAGYFFPVVDLQIKYIKPLRFQQKVVLYATLREWQHCLKIHYAIVDKASGEKITRGYTMQVAVAMPDEITQYVSPPALIAKVSAALAAR